jgi:hypothetical protein
MTTLIDHLASDRIAGRSLLLAYSVGLLLGVGFAVGALLALTG